MVTAVAVLFVLAGLFFFATGTIGFLRFPDFYSRMHATAKGDTLGTLLFVVGLAIYLLQIDLSWWSIIQTVKLMSIAIFWFLASPTATHALLRSAFESGLAPWTKDGRTLIEWPEGRNE